MKNINRINNLLLVTLSAIILTGCGSVFLEPPKSKIPSVFKTKDIQSKESLNLNPNWWILFNDPILNNLVDYSLENNSDLSIAVLNIKLAKNTLHLLELNEKPTHSLGVNFGADKNLKTNQSSKSNNVSYNMTYEVDLWNSIENAKNAQEWAVMATEQDKESVKLSLISSVISAYYKAIYLNEKIKRAEESVEYYKKLLMMTEVKFKVGKLSGLELAQAKTSLLEQEYVLDEYKQNYFENINALKTLLNLTPMDEFPDNIKIPEKIPIKIFDNIKSDIPSNILKNRPDVLSAQMKIQQSFYNVKVQEAEFYPKITLTGSLGNSTADLIKFVSNPIASIAASIQIPILNYDRNKENLKVSENQYKINALEYQKVLIKAMEDVENRVSFYYYNKNNYQKIIKVYEEKQKISKIYEVRYNAGVAPLQDLLDAQEKERQAYLNQLSHVYDLINSESQVYQSLGGKYN